jgi:UDP-N-acetylglucosamine acyltransferase
VTKIHSTAIVNKKSEIDSSAEIGPYVIIEGGVKIGKNVKLNARAYISKGTEIGEGTTVDIGAVLGNLPQDLNFKEKETYLKIGKNNIIREYVTIHRATKDGECTEVGNNCFLMALSHIGHDCKLKNNIILANGALLAGHIEVDEGVFVSGNVVVHQFCKIGKLAMIGGFSGVNMDVPPFAIIRGASTLRGINLIGLRRAGYSKEVMREIKNAYKIIYESDIKLNEATKKLINLRSGKEVQEIVNFISRSKRGICRPGTKKDIVENY